MPLRFKPQIAERVAERPEEQTELKELGIEFGGGRGSETQIEKPITTPSTVSLKDAVKKEPVSFRRKRKEVNLKDLRKTIEEAISAPKQEKKK